MSFDNQLVSIPAEDGQVALYHLVGAEHLYDPQELSETERERVCKAIATHHRTCCLGRFPDLQATEAAVEHFKDQTTVEHGWSHLG